MAKALPEVSNGGRTFTYTLRDEAQVERRPADHGRRLPVRLGNASKRENNWVGFGTVIDRIESFSRRCQDRRGDAEGDAGPVAGAEHRQLHRAGAEAHLGGQALARSRRATRSSSSRPSSPVRTSPKELPARSSHVFERNPNWWGKAPTWTRSLRQRLAADGARAAQDQAGASRRRASRRRSTPRPSDRRTPTCTSGPAPSAATASCSST